VVINWDVLQDPEILARLVLQVALFVASALFSMSETALFSLRESDLARLEAADDPRAPRLRRLLDEPRRLIVSILCGNELINIAATINLAGIFLVLFATPQAAAIANTLVMLPLLLIFCEITPKTLAVTRPVPLSTRIVEPLITTWVRLVAPLRMVVRFASDQITSLIVGEARSERNILSPDAFEAFLRDVEKEGVVTAPERRLIVNLLGAGTTPVSKVMVPRPQVAFIDADAPVPEILEQFRRLRHRRVPLYRGRRDNVVGMLKEEQILQALQETPTADLTLADICQPASLVPASQMISELAELFKSGDHHAAIVVDEYGGVEGLISADDVFGYLTRGRAVFLEDHAEIEEVEAGVWKCSGLTPIDLFRRATNIVLEEDAGVNTVGGLVMVLLKRVPAPGDAVTDGGVVLRVLEMAALRIDTVLVAPEGHPILDADVPEAAE